MKAIDLHGIRHRDIYYALERLCTEYDTPFIVITGKSATMKKIVVQVVKTFGLNAREKLGNSGRLIVCENL